MKVSKAGLLDGPVGQVRKRRAQSRAKDTRLAILHAALREFAAHGFDGASTWRIANSAGVHQQLIVYHFKNKDALWRDVARYYLSELADQVEKEVGVWEGLAAGERVRSEFRLIMMFVTKYPDIHRFMMQESLTASSRLDWLTRASSKPTMERILPHIQQAQQDGDMAPGDPVAVYYVILSSILSLAAFSEEMKRTIDISEVDSQLVDKFWCVIEAAHWRCPKISGS